MISKIFNCSSQKELRKELRNNMTPCERILWSKLKGRQIAGYKFRRQHGIGRYVVDYYCPELNLAIEVDGDVHAVEINKENDASRQEYIESLGIIMKRYTNNEVRYELQAVLDDLFNFIKEINRS